MSFYTADQIDSISDAVLREYGYTGTNFFVDVTKIATNAGVDVNEVDFEGSDEISGTLITRGGKQTINVNRRDTEERKRFTIAHEISHIILHSNGAHDHIDYRQATKNYTSQEELTKEVQANMLAAAILMPRDTFKIAWNDFKDVDQIAELFKVSKRAAAIRLESLGLI